jgi:multiple antibiotic resistance protein
MRTTGVMAERRGRSMCLRLRTYLVVAFTVAVGYLLDASIASAADAATSQVQVRDFSPAQIFTFLFLMLGPFKIIEPFVRITKDADSRLTRQIAVWATIFSSLALLAAAFLGQSFLRKYGIPLPVLALSGGIIFFLVALKGVLAQFAPLEPRTDEVGVAPAAAMKVAMMPLAFPTIVTPYGIAALVVMLSFSQSLEDRLIVGAVVLAIMATNLMIMLLARRLMPVLSVVLPILGAVLGVVQVALGLQIIHNALRMMGLL